MLVSRLIELLQELPPDKKVLLDVTPGTESEMFVFGEITSVEEITTPADEEYVLLGDSRNWSRQKPNN